jgi:hypothetical protein
MSEESTKSEQAQPDKTGIGEHAPEHLEIKKPDTYTADQMEAVKNQIWAEARRKYQKSPTEPPKAAEPKPPPTPEPASAKTGVYNNWRDIFADTTEDMEISFGKGQRRVLRDSFLAEKPGDPVAWIQERCEAFGIPAGEKEPEPKPTEPAMPTGKPASDYGAPTSSPVWERPTNPLEWTQDDVDRIYALKGRREGQRFIRQKTQEFMKNVVVKLGPDR